MALAGVYYLKQVSFEADLSAYIMGITAALFAGVAYTCINILKTSEHPLVIMFYFPLIVLAVITPYTLSHWTTPNLNEFILILILGSCIQAAQYFLTLAYQRGQPDKIGPVYYIEILLSGIWGTFIFHEKLILSQYLGILLILTAITINGILSRKSRARTIEP